MDPLQFSVLGSQQPMQSFEAWSALPNAPQVPHIAKVQPVRVVTARALLRLADRLAPAPSPSC